jgi:hypothetical protein
MYPDAGTGGVSQGGSGGSTAQAVYCQADTDCLVIENCCMCAAFPKGVPTPGCPIPECKASECEINALPDTNPHCPAGHCTLDIECDALKVACNALPPECPSGKVAAVKDLCWTGHCVDPTACMSVTDCSVCTSNGAICVADEAWTKSFHCVPKDPACDAVTCACYGSKVCIGGFNACGEGPAGSMTIGCGCPTC